MKETARRWLFRILKLVLTLAATYFLFKTLSVSWGQLQGVDPDLWTPRLLPIVAAATLAVVSLLYTILLWARLVQVLGGPPLAPLTAVSVFLVSSLARYIPGKLWQVASLAYLASREGVTPTVASSAALLGHLLNLGAAVVVGGLALGLGGLARLPQDLSIAALALAALVAGAIAVPSVLRTLLRLAFRLGRERSPLPALDNFFGIRWIALYTPAWIGFGSGFVLLWASLPALPAANWQAGVGIFAAAYFVGYAALFAPAGLGVREGVMALLLAPWIGPASALVFSVVARVWLTLCELLPFLALIPRWMGLERDRGRSSTLLTRFAADPLGFVKRALVKSILGRWIYGKGPGYDARRYWEKRFDSYGPTLKAAGDEGFSEAENRARYAEDARTFLDVCRREGVDLESAYVLEIGCGTGFYTGLMRDQGVERYLGVDITERLFEHLRERFPTYEFKQLDITEERPPGRGFELVLMIDVIEHIVEEERLEKALGHAAEALASDGVFILAPVMPETRKRSFYLHDWSAEAVEKALAQKYAVSEPVPFRDGEMVAIRAKREKTRDKADEFT